MRDIFINVPQEIQDTKFDPNDVADGFQKFRRARFILRRETMSSTCLLDRCHDEVLSNERCRESGLKQTHNAQRYVHFRSIRRYTFSMVNLI